MGADGGGIGDAASPGRMLESTFGTGKADGELVVCDTMSGDAATTGCGAPGGNDLLSAERFWKGFSIPRSTGAFKSGSGGGSSNISCLGAGCAICSWGDCEGRLGAAANPARPPLTAVFDLGLLRNVREGVKASCSSADGAPGVDCGTGRFSRASGGVRVRALGRCMGGFGCAPGGVRARADLLCIGASFSMLRLCKI